LLLSVARLVEWKGQDVVIRALHRVREEVPAAAYLIVGDGPYRRELERLVSELGLEQHVTFAGFVPESELPSYYRAADAMVVPSREFRDGLPIEGFGIVYMEASACGTPVIGGRGGGTDESILDGETGYQVDQNDPEAVADAAIRLLEDRDLAERMGRNGHQRAVRGFDWKIQADKLRRFLEDVTGSS
jgi:phosphatidylinositol alpha-1,6-mannosyltransferase